MAVAAGTNVYEYYPNTNDVWTWPKATYYCYNCQTTVSIPHNYCWGTSSVPNFCGDCGYWHGIGSPCVKAQPKQEEPEVTDDKKTIDILDEMRVYRDNAVRLAQMKNDEASLLELEANRLRGEADMVLREVNEQRKVKDAK